MIITYHTGACVRISAGDTTLVFGPVSKAAKHFKATNFGADVAFVPMNHPDMDGVEEATRGDKEPFRVFGPGEYEIKDVAAYGFQTNTRYGVKPGDPPRLNTVYAIHFDGLSVWYLGALGETQLPADLLEMDAPDVLILPVGGNGALTASEAQKLAVKLEAKIVIPILYDGLGSEGTLSHFLKEAGAEDVRPVDKLTIKPRDVAEKENEVVVLGG